MCHRDWHLISLELRLSLIVCARVTGWERYLLWSSPASTIILLLVHSGLLKSNLSIVGNASFSSAFSNHGCSDRLPRCFLCFVSSLTHAAQLFLNNAIPSHAVYDSKATNCSHTVMIDCTVLADISVYCNEELYGEQ